jgi:hypothetical protein
MDLVVKTKLAVDFTPIFVSILYMTITAYYTTIYMVWDI